MTPHTNFLIPSAVEIHEDWIEAHRYLNMEMLREQRKELQLLEAA